MLDRRLSDERNRLERYRLILEENRPEKILDKGYAIIESEDGKVIASISDFQEGMTYRIRMRDGEAAVTLKNIQKEGETVEL